MSKETIETTDSVAMSGGSSIAANESESEQIHVVAIGASAGGLESIERFFENIDEDTGAAFVVIQHLSPDFKSFMPEILSKKTRLQVLTATDQMPILPNIIYLMPPRMSLFIEDNILYLNDLKRTRVPNKPINMFFEALANDVGENATAVVLSGTGTDGADGVLKIHEAGGKVYVESPASAKFDGMPAAALSQRIHDGQGTPFEIAGEIFGKDVSDFLSSTMVLKKELDGSDERVRIFKAIENRYGVDFARYKIATVNRRIDRRITELNLKSIDAYWEFIQINQDEITTLYYEMLIGVTKFFRDPEAFDLLKEDVRRIVEGKDPGEEVRIWSAGCASGEETYSLAMMFSDEIKRTGKSLHLKVFATDIDDEILGRATNGLYRKDQMDDVSDKFKARYFNETSDRYKVTASLRSRVVFARHNIMNDPPFAKLDMIACRNLLIYLDNNTQRQVLSLFYFSLNPMGTLFLGPSESLGKYEAGYETTDSKWKIFSKSVNSLPAISTFQPTRKPEREFPVVVDSSQRPASFARTTAMKINSDVAYQSLLEQFVPSGLLIDESQELLHAYGETPFTLSFKPGKVSNNLRSFLDENLCTAVSVCIQRAKRERISVEYANFVIVEEDRERHIDFKVTPIIPKTTEHISYFLITFGEQEVAGLSAPATKVVVEKSVNLEQVSVLEEELKNTKLHLQSTIEELESTNEELQSTNEELLASNEELQSTNEELHSVNEELYTVNAEYQSKITELNQLSMDEEHLFHSTGVGTIFIDQERRIRKFTPTAAELFNLLSQDQGRPFDHVTHLFEGVNFNQLVEQSISTQEIVEAEVTTRSGEPHIIKIVPYQNDRDEPDGVVISFVSMQARKNAEQLYRDMFQASPVGIVGLTPDLKIVSLNASLKNLIGYSDDVLLGQSLDRLFPESQLAQASQIIKTFISGGSKPGKPEQVASTVMRQDGMDVPVEISVSSVPTANGTVVHLYITDMTDRQHYL
ncbi:MAG: CheR family methyltransferase, partial [Gammaproteobacteria bacterium]